MGKMKMTSRVDGSLLFSFRIFLFSRQNRIDSMQRRTISVEIPYLDKTR